MKLSKETFVNIALVDPPFTPVDYTVRQYSGIAKNPDNARIHLDPDSFPTGTDYDKNGQIIGIVPHKEAKDKENVVEIWVNNTSSNQVYISLEADKDEICEYASRISETNLAQDLFKKESLRNYDMLAHDEEYDELFNSFFLDVTRENIEKGQFNLAGLLQQNDVCDVFATVVYDIATSHINLLVGLTDGSGRELTWTAPISNEEKNQIRAALLERVSFKKMKGFYEADKVQQGMFVKEYLLDNGHGYDTECDSWEEVFNNVDTSSGETALKSLRRAEMYLNEPCREYLHKKTGIIFEDDECDYGFVLNCNAENTEGLYYYPHGTNTVGTPILKGVIECTPYDTGSYKEIPVEFNEEELERFKAILVRKLDEDIEQYNEEKSEKNIAVKLSDKMTSFLEEKKVLNKELEKAEEEKRSIIRDIFDKQISKDLRELYPVLDAFAQDAEKKVVVIAKSDRQDSEYPFNIKLQSHFINNCYTYSKSEDTIAVIAPFEGCDDCIVVSSQTVDTERIRENVFIGDNVSLREELAGNWENIKENICQSISGSLDAYLDHTKSRTENIKAENKKLRSRLERE